LLTAKESGVLVFVLCADFLDLEALLQKIDGAFGAVEHLLFPLT
jgi:hypothetical protein